jgi:5-methylcytosine-specific restriction endonuclease McrBC regulatory subunit McrC
MLNFVNNVFLDDVDVSGHIINEEKDSDISKFVLYYLFVQSLEKAFLLGLPQTYQTTNHHESKLKGKVNINAFIRKNIPFTGKISSTSREQKEITEIIDVLYKAVKIISFSKFSTKNITHIKTHLKGAKSQYFVSDETIKKALNSKALQNPIFSPYKQVIEYAKIIIKNHSIDEKKDGNKECYGFIINVAELFEIYVTKLLQKSFPEWTVSSPKITLYDNPKLFFSRKIIPDIVMQKDNDVVVFDTKYKRMNYHGNSANGMGDLDRNDFFQINTYMTYYQQQGKKLLCGGLLYPLSGEHDINICHAENWLGNTSVKFLIDGIKIDDNTELLTNEEDNFIKRLAKVMNI